MSKSFNRKAQLTKYDFSEWTPIPLDGRSKRPLHRNWTKRDYKAKAVIRDALDTGRNVGIRLHPDQLIVDVDPRNGGAAGFTELCLELGLDPDEWPEVKTGSGGSHYYLRKPADVRIVNQLDAFPGVEFKSAGRQVVAAGSTHPDTGKPYTWNETNPPLEEASGCPAVLLKAITRPERSGEAVGGGEYTPKQLESALEAVDVTEFNSNDKWLTLMMAAHHATAGEGCEEFIAWSTSDPTYADHAEKIRNRWDSLDSKKPGGITFRTLNKLLAEHGAADLQAPPTVPEDEFPDDLLDVPVDPPKIVFKPSPMEWIDPAKIPQREWIYKPAYIAGYVSLTTAAGGGGKSSLVRAECAAIASGKPLLGIQPKRARTWYWNGEDPKQELVRGFAAIRLHYNLQKDAVDWLFFDSGRDMPIKVAKMRRGDFTIAEPVVDALIDAIRANNLGVMAVDPFVTTHEVNENDNMMMNAVVDQWRKVADATGAAIHLVHHTRKTNGELANIEASRGASAVSSAARVRRAINTMTQSEADAMGIERAERFRYISADYRSTSFIPSGEALAWYRFEGVNLGNGPCGDGDSIGAVTACDLGLVPVVPDQQEAALEHVRQGGPWSRSAQARAWVGRPIAEGLGLNVADKGHRKRLTALVNDWIATGLLREVPGVRKNRTACTYVEAGEDFG